MTVEPILERRDLLKRALGAGAAVLAARSLASAQDLDLAAKGRKPDALAADEEFWAGVRAAFTLDPKINNLNNGGVSPAPRSVHEAFKQRLDVSNLAPAHSLWQVLEPRVEGIRARLARTFGCDPEELAITRNATEALELCQLGIPLEKGDEVVATDQDYPRMLDAWGQRERRDGIVLRKIALPMHSPEGVLISDDEIVSRFEKAITSRTRVLLVTHLTNRTGRILPVKRLCDLARAKGVETIVDGAQSFAHFPFKVADLGCDYFGTSLHKWLMAPHGTGFLYVRRARIKKLWPLFAAPATDDENIRKLEQIGTHPAANHGAIEEALDFHERLGVERKAARLRYLRERWTLRLARAKGARILTSAEPAHACGIGLVSFAGVDHDKLARTLLDEHSILVAPIGGADLSGIRVTPGVYSTLGEVDAFAAAVEKVLGR